MLSLEDAIALALKQNVNLQASRDRVTSAEISLEAAKSDFRIKIRPEISNLFQQSQDLSQNYGLNVSKKFSIGGELSSTIQTKIRDDAEEKYQTDVTFAYTQPLLEGRGALAATQEITSAERSLQSQHRSLIQAQEQLMLNVATSYYGIVRDHMLLKVNQRALERSKLLLEAAEAKLKVGMASKMDVFRAEMQVLTAENGVVDAAESLDNTKRRFSLLLGLNLETEFFLTSTLEYSPMTPDKDELIQHALDHRPELYDAYQNIQQAEDRVNIARQNLYPPLDISIRYTFSGDGNAFGDSLDLQDTAWGIGVNSSFHLDFANDRASYEQAKLSLNGAMRNFQSKQQDILLEVLQTINSVMQAQARVELQRRSVLQAEKQLELSELRYKKGLSDNLDVIDAEEALSQANSSYYSAIAQHLIAKMKLQQVTGTLQIPVP